MPDTQNTLYYGDNLDVLRRYIKDESVDLVYLDPPFNSAQDYNVLFKEQSGDRAAAQIKAFEDTWRWDQASESSYRNVVQAGGPVSIAMQSLRSVLGENDMMAYLSMMAPRLLELKRVLRSTGSIYLHCDTGASHYLKMLMDSIFGSQFFRNEIIWRRYGTHNDVGQGSRHFGRVHDTILFYVKSEGATWQQIFVPLKTQYVEQTYRYVDEETGKRFTTTPLTGPGGAEKGNPVYEWNGHTRAWRYNKQKMQQLHDDGLLYYSKTGYVRQKHYLEDSKGAPVQDEWDDIPSLSGAHAERLGYPTQKPVALMERIIGASSMSGAVVLDPFCGCGTTIEAAQRLGRDWIGIDITHLAISLLKHRLADAFGGECKYNVVGEPVSLPDAVELAREDPFQFQWWTLGLVHARPAQGKKGADKGIDGRLYFHDEASGAKTKQVIFSVKAGHTGAAHVRDLRGVIDRENAAIGVLISMVHSTQPMRSEAASAGFYHSPGWNRDYPRLQLLTIEELLGGKTVDMPPIEHVNTTFKQAQRSKGRNTQRELPL